MLERSSSALTCAHGALLPVPCLLLYARCSRMPQFASRDDPFLPWEEQMQVARGLEADLREYDDMGHFQVCLAMRRSTAPGPRDRQHYDTPTIAHRGHRAYVGPCARCLVSTREQWHLMRLILCIRALRIRGPAIPDERVFD